MTRLPCRALPPDGRFLAQLGPTLLVAVRLDSAGPAIWCKLEFLIPSGSTSTGSRLPMVAPPPRTS